MPTMLDGLRDEAKDPPDGVVGYLNRVFGLIFGLDSLKHLLRSNERDFVAAR